MVSTAQCCCLLTAGLRLPGSSRGDRQMAE